MLAADPRRCLRLTLQRVRRRLWASSGQSALENANILVINGSATGSSALKNLVLPGELSASRSRLLTPRADSAFALAGIGKFTILDPAPVDGPDIGNNFFLEPSSLGKPRAEEVVRYLLELNSDVRGEAVVQVSCVLRLWNLCSRVDVGAKSATSQG